MDASVDISSALTNRSPLPGLAVRPFGRQSVHSMGFIPLGCLEESLGERELLCEIDDPWPIRSLVPEAHEDSMISDINPGGYRT